jgi:hypothetical protein
MTDGSVENLKKRRYRKHSECKDPATGEERAINRKARIFGRGPQENDGPIFQMGEKGVLLTFIKPVNLIEKENRPSTRFLKSYPGFGKRFSKLFHTG